MENKILINFFGKCALWTDPVSKADPCSYSIPTESSLKGLIDSIYWKPEIANIGYIKFNKIIFNKKPKEFCEVYNGRKSCQSKDKTNIYNKILYDIDFVVDCDFVKNPNLNDEQYKNWMKHNEILLRRLNKKEPHYNLYFGTKENKANFKMISNISDYVSCDWSERLGRMFWKFKYKDNKIIGRYFWNKSYIINGSIDVPDINELEYEEVSKNEKIKLENKDE